MSHISFGTIQKPLELQPVGIPVGDDIPHLSHYRGEYEDANQIADYCENVPEGELSRLSLDPGYNFTVSGPVSRIKNIVVTNCQTSQAVIG